MVLDAVRGYLALATGLSEVTRQKALGVAKAMVAQGEATAEQVAAITEDLLTTSASNRSAVINIVRLEVDRARAAIGLANAGDIAALRSQVERLEASVRALQATVSQRPAPAKTPAAKSAPKSAAKAPAAKVPAAKAPADTAEGKKVPASKAPAVKRAPAKKAPAKKAAAKSTPAKSTPAKKAAPGATAGP